MSAAMIERGGKHYEGYSIAPLTCGHTMLVAVTTFTIGSVLMLWSQLAYVLFLVETCRWAAGLTPLFATCAR